MNHIDILAKRAAIPPASPEVLAEALRQLESVNDTLRAAMEIAKAGGQLVAITKAGVSDEVRSKLPAAQEAARRLVADVKGFIRSNVDRLRPNAMSEPGEREAILAEIDRRDIKARAACMEVARLVYTVLGTGVDAAEQQALLETANAWLDQAANIRDALNP
jgi:hypothetical protein